MYDTDFPVTEHANGVSYRGRFFPFKTQTVVPAVPAGTVLQIPPGRRWYLRHVLLDVRVVAGDTTTLLYLTGYVNRLTGYLTRLSILPGVAATYTLQEDLHVLLDRESTVTALVDVAPTLGRVILVYAEVDDNA